MSEDKSIVHFLPLHYLGRQMNVTLDEEGRTWWLAQTVCEALGLTNTTKALQGIRPKDLRITKGYMNRGAREVCLISEPGLWRLVMRSNRPEAEALQDWVYEEVLPTLRRTGSYTIPHVQDQAPLQDQLTPQGQLPPPAPRVRERAEISWHLAAVWSLLVRTGECLTHHEIAQRTGVALPTARAHTRYLVQLGMLERHETHPRHLYEVSAQAANRNVGVYQRLQRLTEVIQARHAF